MIIEKKFKKQENMYEKGYQEIPDAPSNSKKAKARHRIENEVFDLRDSVADNSKMISLLISLVSRIYSTLTATAKGKLSSADKALIETVITEFKNVNTRADVQLAKEGPSMITKILSRQAQIGTIVSQEL